MARRARLNRVFMTTDIATALKMAMAIGSEWQMPAGRAVIRDVKAEAKGRYTVTYRLISEWGKEAW